MKMRKRNVFLLLAAVLLVASFALAACGTKKVGHIDIPATLEADLGVYVSPDYDVVDDNGVVLYGYDVRIKQVKDPNGEKVDVTNESVSVQNAGVYTFVYTADSKKVKDATVKIDFADRTAPRVNYDPSNLPSFFIKGNSYSMPDYTLSGDYVAAKCRAKVFHIAADSTETEVAVSGNRFKVEQDGKYAIRIHVEDAAGNANDYEYVRNVDGPVATKENTVLYFGEEFGARQMKMREADKYTGEFVSKENAPAAVRAKETDKGYFAVKFNGTSETDHNEGYAIIDVPAIVDVRDFSELSLWVYYDGDNKFPAYNDDGTVKSTEDKVVVGSTWWNDTTVPNKTWTQVTWSVNDWGNNLDKNGKQVGTSDISGTLIRMLFDYKEKVKPNGTFYFTEMVGTPKVPATIVAATGDENVIIEGSKHFIGDPVQLSSAFIEGKQVNCYTVDGHPIAGDTFVASKANHKVGVTYVDGALTLANMTWGTEFADPSQTKWQKSNNILMNQAGESNYWAIETEIEKGYNAALGGNCKFNLAYALGDNNALEIMLEGTDTVTGCIKWYYKGDSVWNEKVCDLTAGQVALLQNASASDPVKVLAVRKGEDIRFFMNGQFLGRTSLDGYAFSDRFAFGWRDDRAGGNKPINELQTMAGIKSVKAVAGEEKVKLVLGQYTCALTSSDHTVTFETDTVFIGDEVRLTAAPAPAGKAFAYFTVDGVRKYGSWATFMATEEAHDVKAVYTDAVTLTLEGGARVNNKSGTVVVAMNEAITITYLGNPGAGRFFDCFTVDGAPLNGNTFTPTKAAYTIGVKTATGASDMTWADLAEDSSADVGGTTVYKTGASSDHWVLEYKIVKNVGTNSSIGAYIGGNFWVEFEIGSENKVHGYIGAASYWTKVADLSGAMTGKLQNAGTTPVTAQWIRAGKELFAYLDGEYAGKFNLGNFGAAEIGTAYRNNGTSEHTSNIRYVTGESKTEAYMATLPQTTLTVGAGIKANGKTGTVTVLRGETVTLTTTDASAKLDYFTVGGQPIAGNTFVATGETQTVGLKTFTNASDMTWAEQSYNTNIPTGGDAQVAKYSSGKYWALEYEAYGLSAEKIYVGAHVGGTDQAFGFQVDGDGKKLGGYGGTWQQMFVCNLTQDQINALRNATESTPAKISFVRNNDTISAYLNGVQAGKCTYSAFNISGDDFGLGTRKNYSIGTLKNIRYVTGESKMEAYLATLPKTTLTVGAGIKANGKTGTVTVFRGETVTLTAADASAKVDYFTVGGQPIVGNTFVATGEAQTVGLKTFTNASDMTWAEQSYNTNIPTGGDAQVAKYSSGKYWALEYEAYNLSEGNIYVGAHVGGTDQALGFQVDGSEQKLGGYGGKWKQPNVCNLTEDQINALRNATEAAPAKVLFVRNNDTISAYLNGVKVGECTYSGFEINGDDFGLGTRNGYSIGTLKNIRYVTGESKTAAYMATLPSTSSVAA